MGRFIVFEGCDGAGKTEMVGRTCAYLLQEFPDQVVYSKDPGGTKLGQAIRRIMYEEVTTHEMSPGVVDLLMLASHLQNWDTVVRPALMAGKFVVSDRWWPSQEAYMIERYVPPKIAESYSTVHGADPDVMFFLHSRDIKVLVDRARARRGETHQSAKKWDDYDVLSRVQDNYFKLFYNKPWFFPIDVSGKSIDEVWGEVRAHLARRYCSLEKIRKAEESA